MELTQIRPASPTLLHVALAVLIAGTGPADAQSNRYWNRTVAPGKQLEMQWTNYDEATCRDNGYARLVINRKPTLGQFRTAKRKVTQRNGKCKGSRFSVLDVIYKAGKRKGSDRAAYTIRGAGDVKVNLNVDVR